MTLERPFIASNAAGFLPLRDSHRSAAALVAERYRAPTVAEPFRFVSDMGFYWSWSMLVQRRKRMVHLVHYFVMPALVAGIHVAAACSEASSGLPVPPHGWPEQVRP